MKLVTLVFLIAAALVVAACGESSQDKAQKKVCSARSDIQKQVTQLQSLTPTTATTNGIKDSLNAIKTDLDDIAGAQGDLNADKKKQVQAANDKFVSEFKSIAGDLGTNLSIADAQAKLKAAAQKLVSTYQTTFAKVDCGS